MVVSRLLVQRRWLWYSGPLALVVAVVAGPGRWAAPGPALTSDSVATIEAHGLHAAASPSTDDLAWPERRLEGEPAKRRLLAGLTLASERLERVGNYRATLVKRERIGGILGLEEQMEVKVRHRPFAVYLKYRGQKAGREVMYAEGRDDNKLVAYAADWTSRLVPRLVLEPMSTLAMIDNRHPITEAGLAHLVGKLCAAVRLDLGDPGVATVLDRHSEDGRNWLRSVQTYTRKCDERPLCRVEVLYDPETRLPLRFTGDEWPEPGRQREPQLGEFYRYEDLRLDAGLSDADFDSQNPAYAFAHR